MVSEKILKIRINRCKKAARYYEGKREFDKARYFQQKAICLEDGNRCDKCSANCWDNKNGMFSGHISD